MFFLNLVVLFTLVNAHSNAQVKSVLAPDKQCALFLEEAFYFHKELLEPDNKLRTVVSQKLSQLGVRYAPQVATFREVYSFVAKDKPATTQRLLLGEVEGDIESTPVYLELQKGTLAERYSNLKAIEDYLLHRSLSKNEGMMIFSRESFKRVMAKVFKRAKEEDFDRTSLEKVVVHDFSEQERSRAIAKWFGHLCGVGSVGAGAAAAYFLSNEVIGGSLFIASIFLYDPCRRMGFVAATLNLPKPPFKLDSLYSPLHLLKFYSQGKIESGIITVPWNSKKLTLFLEKDRVILLIWKFSVPIEPGILPNHY